MTLRSRVSKLEEQRGGPDQVRYLVARQYTDDDGNELVEYDGETYTLAAFEATHPDFSERALTVTLDFGNDLSGI